MGSRLRTAATSGGLFASCHLGEVGGPQPTSPRHQLYQDTNFEDMRRLTQQTQTRAAPQPVGTHRQQLYATGIPTPANPRPPHPHPPHPHPARRHPHPGPRQPHPATRAPRQPHPATRAPRQPHPAPRHPPPRHPHPPTRPTLPKAAWPPPQPRPPQRADASVLERATAPLRTTRAAMTRTILRSIGFLLRTCTCALVLAQLYLRSCICPCPRPAQSMNQPGTEMPEFVLANRS
jgi:hypothetical protein